MKFLSRENSQCHSTKRQGSKFDKEQNKGTQGQIYWAGGRTGAGAGPQPAEVCTPQQGIWVLFQGQWGEFVTRLHNLVLERSSLWLVCEIRTIGRWGKDGIERKRHLIQLSSLEVMGLNLGRSSGIGEKRLESKSAVTYEVWRSFLY